MDLREELTRQSLLLEFISECVSLQSVPDLAKLVTSRLHWICDYDACSALLPEAQGLSLWSQDRKAGGAPQIDDDVTLARHRAALTNAMARGSPTVAHHDESKTFLAALPWARRRWRTVRCVSPGWGKDFRKGMCAIFSTRPAPSAAH